MDEQSQRQPQPAKHTGRTYNPRMWWKCWDMHKSLWRNDRVQESFITIYLMNCRAPFSAIPEYIFREILTYVDLEECHRLKMQKVFDEEEKALWWEYLYIPDWMWKREEMQRAFIEIYRMKYRAPFSAIPTYIFREILTYSQLEENKEADN